MRGKEPPAPDQAWSQAARGLTGFGRHFDRGYCQHFTQQSTVFSGIGPYHSIMGGFVQLQAGAIVCRKEKKLGSLKAYVAEATVWRMENVARLGNWEVGEDQ